MSFNDQITRHPSITQMFTIAAKAYGDGHNLTKIAHDMGYINERSLANKLNINSSHANLSLDDVCNILQLTQDARPLRAMAYLAGCTVMPIPKRNENDNRDVVMQFINVFSACGDVGNAVKQATQDSSEAGKDLSNKERREIVAKLDELIAAAIHLRQEVVE